MTIASISIILASLGWYMPSAFADNVTATITVGHNPTGIGINKNTNMIYVANLGNNTISEIDGTTNTVVNTILLPDAPNNQISIPVGVAVNSITNMIYVGIGTANYPEVIVIDGSTNTVKNIINLPSLGSGTSVREIAVNPVTNMIYVSYFTSEHLTGIIDPKGGSIAVINGTTNSLVSNVSVSGFPVGVAVNPVTNKIYSADMAAFDNNNNLVSVIDGLTNIVTNSIPVPNTPYYVDMNPNTNMVYVTENSGSQLAVIDGVTNSIVTTIMVGPSPSGVSVNPETNKIYVNNEGNNTVSVIDGSSNQMLDTMSAGSNPIEIAANSNTNEVYVGNYDSNTVTVIQGTISKVPPPPTGLVAASKFLQINLSWNAPSDDNGSVIIGYKIERSTNDGTTWNTVVDNTRSAGTTYSDANVLPLTTYTYRVFAINGVGTSNPSNMASATTPSVGPVTPSSLT